MPRSVTRRQKPHPSSDEPSPGSDYPDLVKAASTGDAAALDALLLRAQEVAYRFSLTVCGHAEDAEDVMQEALIKTYQHVEGIREPAAFRGWLYRTVKNACLMRRRLRRHEPRHLLSIEDDRPDGGGAGGWPVADAAIPADEALSRSAERRRLREALSRLPGRYRVVVFLRQVEGLSTREVAGVLGISEASVKMRLHRAHGLLRREMSA